MMVRSCCAMQDRSLVLQRLLEAEVVVESESIIIVVVLYRRHDFVASNCLAWCTQSVHKSAAAEELRQSENARPQPRSLRPSELARRRLWHKVEVVVVAIIINNK